MIETDEQGRKWEVKDGKKQRIFDVNNPTDMQEANAIATTKLAQMQGKGDGLKSKEQFEKEAEIEAKLEKAEQSEQLFNEMKSNIENDYTEKGLRLPNITDAQSLKDALVNLDKIEKLEKNQKPKVEPTGSAPLSPEQLSGGIAPKQGFESYEQMVDHLNNMKAVGSPEEQAYAKQALEQLMLKFAKGSVQQPRQVQYEDPEWFKRLQSQTRQREQLRRDRAEKRGRDQ